MSQQYSPNRTGTGSSTVTDDRKFVLRTGRNGELTGSHQGPEDRDASGWIIAARLSLRTDQSASVSGPCSKALPRRLEKYITPTLTRLRSNFTQAGTHKTDAAGKRP